MGWDTALPTELGFGSGEECGDRLGMSWNPGAETDLDSRQSWLGCHSYSALSLLSSVSFGSTSGFAS